MRVNIFFFSSLCLSPAGASHLLTCWCILLSKINEKLVIKGVQEMQSKEIVSGHRAGHRRSTGGSERQSKHHQLKEGLPQMNPNVLLLKYNRNLFPPWVSISSM